MVLSCRATVIVPTRDDSRFHAFVRMGVASRVASCADVYEIQAQGSEANAAKFHDFVV